MIILQNLTTNINYAIFNNDRNKIVAIFKSPMYATKYTQVYISGFITL